MFHRLPKGDFAATEPLVHSLDEGCEIAQVIRDKEPLQKQTLFDGHQQISRACGFTVVAGDHSAQGKACEVACPGKSRVQMIASHVVKVCIDAIRGNVTQGLSHISYALVIDHMLHTDAVKIFIFLPSTSCAYNHSSQAR